MAGALQRWSLTDCASFAIDSPQQNFTEVGHSRAGLCLQPLAQAALGRGWAVTDWPNTRSGRLTGPIEVFNVVIILAGPVVISANDCAEITLDSVGEIMTELTCPF